MLSENPPLLIWMDKISLDTRTANALYGWVWMHDAEMRLLDFCRTTSAPQLLRECKNLGRASLARLEQALSRHGLALRPDARTAGNFYRGLLVKYLAYRGRHGGDLEIADAERAGMLEFPDRFPTAFTDTEWAELQRLASEVPR